jgi:uncharacterized repeat protein (TIGR02543 family)
MKNIKRIMTIILTLAMLCSMLPTGTFAQDTTKVATNLFDDVKQTDWYYDAVLYAYQNGIFSGMPNNKFGPDMSMTRGMYVTVLGRMAKIDASAYHGNGGFSDVDPNAYYAPYVVWAAQNKLTSGIENGKFGPALEITREQLATFFSRYFETFKINYQSSEQNKIEPNDLAAGAAWAKDSILKLWKNRIFEGDKNGDFNPKSIAKRAEVATLSVRIVPFITSGTTPASIGPSTSTSTSPSSNTNTNTNHDPDPDPNTNPDPDPDPNVDPDKYVITFETNGGLPIASIPYEKDKPISAKLPDAKKDGVIFLDWYTDSGLTDKFYTSEPITGNIKLYAKYAELESRDKYVNDSVVYADQGADFSLTIVSKTPLTPENVREGITLEVIGAPESVELEITTTSSASYIVKAKDGFREGSAYTASLKDGLFFAGKGEEIRNASFTIKKDEVEDLKVNDSIEYVKEKEITLSNDEDKKGKGTFKYTGNEIQVGEVVSILPTGETELEVMDVTDGKTAKLVKVTGITENPDGSKTVTYEQPEATEVLNLGETLPFDSSDFETGYTADSTSFTIAKDKVNFNGYEHIGLSANSTIDINDIVVIFGADDAEDPVYGIVTSVEENGGKYIVEFMKTTKDQIVSENKEVYQQEDANHDDLAAKANAAGIPEQIETQVIESKFAEDALSFAAYTASQTDGFKSLNLDDAEGLIGFVPKVDVGDGTFDFASTINGIDVQVRILGKGEKFGGLRCEVKISGEAEVGETDDGKVIMDLSAAFIQELKITYTADGHAVWAWAGPIPYIQDYQANVNVDVYNYSAMSIEAIISSKQTEPSGNETITKILDISEQIQSLLKKSEVNDETGIAAGVQDLFVRYGEMLENETDYITLVNKEIFAAKGSVLYIIAYNFSADFVIKANINVAVGSNFEYESGTRYNFWFKIKAKEAGSSTTRLVDERFDFQFYIMGELGLRIGVELEFAVGLFDTDIASVGFVAEVGVYTEFYGFFIYEYQKIISTANIVTKSSNMAGAIYLEFGIYLEISFKAQALADTFVYQPTLFEKQWPLLDAGEREYVYDFSYQNPSTKEENYVIKNRTYAILPDSYWSMKCLDLTTGELYDNVLTKHRFTYSISNPAFTFDEDKGKMTVSVPENVRYLETDLTIKWAGAKLAFSKGELSRTIHVVWTNLTEEEMNLRHNVRVVANGKTIWSTTVGEGVTAELPTEGAIKALLKFGTYMEGTTDLKYTGEYSHYEVPTPAVEDQVYTVTVPEREYTLTVKDVEKADGTKESKTFTAKFGEKFELATLYESGTNIVNATTPACTKYYRTVCDKTPAMDANGNEIPWKTIDSEIDANFAKELLSANGYTAEYADDSVLVNYLFVNNRGEKLGEKVVRVKKDTTPGFDYYTYAKDMVDSKDYMVRSWDKTIGKVTGNETYTGTCVLILGDEHDITFDTKVKSLTVDTISRANGAYLTLPQPVREGYSFGGWYTDDQLTTAFTSKHMGNTAIALFAKWIANVYTITFDTNAEGAAVSGIAYPITTSYGAAYGYDLPKLYRPGYNHTGWSIAKNGTPVNIVETAKDHTLYAIWEEKIAIPYNSNNYWNTTPQTYTYNKNEQKRFELKEGTQGDLALGTDEFFVQYKGSLFNEPRASKWFRFKEDEAANYDKYAVMIYRPEDDEYRMYKTVITDGFIIDKANRTDTTISAPGEVYQNSNKAGYITVGPAAVTGADIEGGILQYGSIGKTIFGTPGPNSIQNWSESRTVNDFGITLVYARFISRNYNDVISTNYLTYNGGTSSDSSAMNVTVKTGNNGSDSNIYIRLNYLDGTTGDKLQMDSSADDFEQNDERTYSFKLNRAWDIKGFDIIKEGKNAWQCDAVTVSFPDEGYQLSKISMTGTPGYFNGTQTKTFNFSAAEQNSTRLEIESMNGFTAGLPSELSLSSVTEDTIKYSFNGIISIGGSKPRTYNGYSRYSILPMISVSLTDTPKNGQYSDYYNAITYSNYDITINKAKLLELMEKHEQDEMEIEINYLFKSADITINSADSADFKRVIHVVK